MMAWNSPVANSAQTPSSARTAVGPEPYTLTRSVAAAAVVTGASTDMSVLRFSRKLLKGKWQNAKSRAVRRASA